jgi:hypothetical protein
LISSSKDFDAKTVDVYLEKPKSLHPSLSTRNFKPASKGEEKKNSRQKKRGRNWHNHHHRHPRRKCTPNPNPKELQANEGVYCTLLSLSLSLSLAKGFSTMGFLSLSRRS